MPDIILDPSELKSPAWTKVREHIEAKIEALRVLNDGDVSERQTHGLRHTIRELRALLDEIQPDPIDVENAGGVDYHT